MSENKPSYKELEQKMIQIEKENLYLKLNNQMFFENNFDGIVIINPETAGFIEFNDQACKQLGYTREEFEILTIFDIEALEKPEETRKRIKQVIETGSAEFETVQRAKNGELKIIAISARMFKRSDKDVYHCIWRDLTELKRNEKEFFEAKEDAEINELLYKSLFHNLNTSSSLYEVIFDTNNTPVDYKFLAVNQWYENTLGIKSSELIGKTLLTIFPKTEPFWLESFKEVVLTGHHATIENYSVEVDRYFELTIFVPQKGQMALIGSDITVRKQNELEIIRAKNKAEESNAYIQTIIENSNNSIWAIDSNCKLTYFNQVFKNEYYSAFGIELKNGLNVIEILPENIKPIWKERYERVLNNEKIYLEDKVEVAPDTFLYISVSMAPILTNNKVIGASLYGANITERKNTETELLKSKEHAEESEALYRKMNENSPLGMHFYKLDENNRLIFVGSNPAADNLLKVDNSQFIGKTIEEAFPPLTQTEVPERYHQAAEKGIPWFTEQISYQDNKITGAFEVRAFQTATNNMVAIFNEITRRKQTEQELIRAKEEVEESEEKHRFLFENTIQGVIYLNPAGEIIYANKAAERILGLNNENIEGLKSGDPRWRAIHEDGSEFPNDTHPSMITIRTGKAVSNVIMGVFNPLLNDYSWININSIPKFRNGENKPYCAVTTFEDITEIRKKNLELKLAKEHAEESDRLKTAFLQNLSHEIRTPLNAICGFSEFLSGTDITDEKRKSYTSIIRNSSNQLLSIVSDILTISSLETKQEKVNTGKVCINNVLIELLSIFKQQALNQNLSLYIKQQLSDKQSEIYTDGTKITQILTNLLTNALKFTHKGSIEFGYNLVENKLEFYVIDTGIGIKPEFCEKIFERFRQADVSINKKYGGTGLGLSISKGFVELLGGKIWVNSEPDKGSTFYFTIPYNPASETIKKSERIINEKSIKTIVVAEDEEYNYLFIEELLVNMNFTLIHTKDGKETVDICKENPNIDLVLMDIKMPEMDGYEAAKIIKKFKPDLPIIAQSAYALDHERAKYVGVFDDYLAKPISSNKLIQSVLKYLNVQSPE